MPLSYENKLKILGISGSVRAASVNRGLIAEAERQSQEDSQFEIEIYDGIASLPIFSEELEGDQRPKSVLDIDNAIRSTDAILISTPEYNGGMPGGLKNLLDWGSRPYGNGALTGKPVAVLGASPGAYGAVRAVQRTVEILRHMRANVLEEYLTVGGTGSKFTKDGVLHDDLTKLAIKELVGHLSQLARIRPAA